MTIVPRWEWRAFAADFGSAERRLAESSPDRVEVSEEVYLLSSASDASVKVRHGQVDAKRLLAVAGGLEQWRPVVRAGFPLLVDDAQELFGLLGTPAPPAAPGVRSPAALVALADARPELLALPVHKRRVHYALGDCLCELSELRTASGTARTLAVESEDPRRLSAVVRELGLADRRVACVARGLKELVGFGRPRAAAIDVGTSSVKLHVGERDAGGAWRDVRDAAEVTRLGEGLERTGRLAPTAIERTVAAVAGMVAEARLAGARDVAAVGTAGLRAATNAADFLTAVEDRCGLHVEVIAAEEEARLAYAAAAGLGAGDGSLVVFDSGGGSSQFTCGRDGHAGERFKLEVGAVRCSERFGLDAPVSADALAVALAAIRADLAPLRDVPRPDRVVGMGGTVTNLAAVKHALGDYDADVVRGTVLDRAEVDRQLELYRTRSVAERRDVAGLQPGRAPVILAGACIVRATLDVLDAQSLTVSDRGVRHGLLLERFPSSDPHEAPAAPSC